jgi:hypothetical protein
LIPIKCGLIGDPGRQVLVMLDLAVEFGALVTHFRFRIPAKLAAIIVAEQTIERLICSGGKLGHF